MIRTPWLAILILTLASLLHAQQALEVQVLSVQGSVQTREDDQRPWQPAAVGMKLPIGGEVRTGIRSAVQLAIGQTQKLTIDRLGVVKILQAIEKDGKIKTDVGMKYGRSGLEVQEGGLEHESTIRSPSATLAVRGSKGFMQEYAGQDPLAGSDIGDVAFINTRGFEIPLDPGNRIRGDHNSAGELALAQGTYNPLGNSLTPPEAHLQQTYPQGTFQDGQQGTHPGMFRQQMDAMHLGGGGTSGVFTMTTGFLEFFAIFTAASSPSTLSMTLLTPDMQLITQGQPGNFTHTGNRTSNNMADAQQVRINTGTNDPLLTGNYIGMIDITGAAAGTIFYEVHARTGSGVSVIPIAGPFNTTNVPAGTTISVPFTLPVNTP
jgi:hypothetical protein